MMKSLSRLTLTISLLISATAAPLAAQASSATRPSVLITDFDPFGGATVNNSVPIAEQVKKQLAAAGIDSQICRLPVVYVKGAGAARKCYQNLSVKPQLVLSLGEAQCTLRVETAGQNLDSEPGFADNDGNIRTDEPIVQGAPMALPLKGFIGDMYCALPKAERSGIEISASPGGFICNDVAYRMGAYFAKTSTLFSFIHVPNHNCGQSRAQILEAGNRIAAMVESLPALGGQSPPVFAQLTALMPTNSMRARSLLQTLRAQPQSASVQCEEEFTSRLKQVLDNFSPKDSID